MQKKDAAGMVQHGRNIAGNEELMIAQPDHGRRAQPRGHNLVRIARRNHSQRIHAVQPLHRLPHCFFQRPSLEEYFSTRCATISVSVSVTNL